MIDFTIKRISANGNTVSLEYTVFQGEVTTKDEYNITTETIEPIERYRRTSVVAQKSTTFNKAEAAEMLHLLGESEAEAIIESATVEENAALLLPYVSKYLEHILQEMAQEMNTTLYVGT